MDEDEIIKIDGAEMTEGTRNQGSLESTKTTKWTI